MSHQTPISITSDTTIEIDTHFKVIAGPGAGKTYWLINQIKSILRNSDQLRAGSKIACISYTNAATEEIVKRLDTPENTVEVSTIHSFLYNNVIKPYVYLLKDEDGGGLVDAGSIRGHDRHFPEYPKIENWVGKFAEESRRGVEQDIWIVNKNKEDLKELICTINPEGECVFAVQNSGYSKIPHHLHDKIVEYKSLYWAEGKLDHNDVLYLSNRIFRENPAIIKFISAKYPYILLDEFQDTNPVQTGIVRDLGECETIIGIVGDPAQSIFSFSGASRKDLLNFHLNGMKVYTIEGNRRSTSNIISLLNHVRQGDEFLPRQKAVPNAEHLGPVNELVISKNSNKILEYFRQETKDYGEDSCCVLARRNKIISKFQPLLHPQIWEELEDIDPGRYLFLKKIMLGMLYAKNKNYFRAISNIESILLTDNNGKFKNKTMKGDITDIIFGTRQLAVSIMHCLIATEYKDMSLMEFYDHLNGYLADQSGVSLKGVYQGKFREAATEWPLDVLYQSLELQDGSVSSAKTIHKSKGTEYDSVLVVFEAISDLGNHLFEPNINSEEDGCRILYVALSRAKVRLFLGVPEQIPLDYYTKLQQLREHLKIVNLDQATLDRYTSAY